MDFILQMKELIAQAEKNGEAFYNKGNKQAGTRLRKNCLDLKNLCGEVRKSVSDVKNAK